LASNVFSFILPIIPYFHLASNVFSSILRTKLSLPHPLALGLTHCICGQPLDPMGTHLFHYSHGEEQISSHNFLQNAFASIMKNMGFHVLPKQIYVLS
jgi:hypothetical protein